MKLSKEFIAIFREEAKKAQWEINRWNGKSIDDLVVDYLERKELKPEDFKDVVVLTVEEAKEMRRLMFGLEMEGVVPCDEFKAMRNNLKKRIKQAEMQDEIK